MNVIGVPDHSASAAQIDAWVAGFHPLYERFYGAVSYGSVWLGPPKTILPPRFVREEADGAKVSLAAQWSIAQRLASLRLEIYGMWGRVTAYSLHTGRRVTLHISLLDPAELISDLLAALSAARVIPREEDP